MKGLHHIDYCEEENPVTHVMSRVGRCIVLHFIDNPSIEVSLNCVNASVSITLVAIISSIELPFFIIEYFYEDKQYNECCICYYTPHVTLYCVPEHK